MNKLLILLSLVFISSLAFVSATVTWDNTAYWDFETGSGTNVRDVVYGLNNGTLNFLGDADWHSPKLGSFGIGMNGTTTNGQINITDSTGLDLVNGTISAWVNLSSNTTNQMWIYNKGTGNGDTQNFELQYDGVTVNNGYFCGAGGGGTSVTVQGGAVTTGVYHHVVCIFNTSIIQIWIDGVLEGQSPHAAVVITPNDINMTVGRQRADGSGNYFNGTIDEFGIWNRTLSFLEVADLYNNGDGLEFNTQVGNQITLNSPIDNFASTDNNLTFNATITPTLLNLTNATLYIWNSTFDVVNNSLTNFLTGENPNTTNWSVEGLPFQTLHWSVFACGNNVTDDPLCFFGASNNTLIIQSFSIDNQAFNNDVLETDSQRFEINVTTIEAILSVTANLIYNNTVTQSGSVTCTLGVCNIFANTDIPLVTSGSSQNKSFFWEINVFDGTSTIVSNSTAFEQNVSQVFFQECGGSVDTLALNFTAFDEPTNTRIDPFYIAGEFEFWLGGGGIKKEFSFSNSSAIDSQLCISPASRNFTLDDTIEYNDVINSTTYNTRNYYFQQEVVNNVTQHIPLFLLNVDDSTSFILKVQDTNLLPISNALIHIQRFNVGTGNFSTVQISRTDDNGQTVGFFKTESVDYRFIIIKNGVTLLTTGSQKVVPETAPFTLTFTVGVDEGSPWTRFEDLPELTSTLVFNDSTSIVSYTYVDTSGSFTLGRLLVVAQNQSGSARTVCDVNSSLTSAVLTCDTGNVTGTYTSSGFITRGSDVFLVKQIIFIIESFSDVAGLLGVFLAFFVILISAFMFKFNEIAGIVLMNLTVIFVNMIGLVNFGFLFIFGMLGVSIMIIVLLER